MQSGSSFRLAIGVAFSLLAGNGLAHAQITFVCDPNVATTTCSYLQTTVAGHYNSTFSNAKANIYILYGDAGLGQSQKGESTIPFQQYVTAMLNNASPSPVQTAASLALNDYDQGPYGNVNVHTTSALGAVLGATDLVGVNLTGYTCTYGDPGCYDGIITITTDPSIHLYYLDQGGVEPDDAYDFYATVEHEVNEVLGTASCIRTASGSQKPATGRHIATGQTAVGAVAKSKPSLNDDCGAGEPSVVDLYRYSATGSLVLDSSLSTKAGAYFSFDGGVTHGAVGVNGNDKHYNTKANGDDYADFDSPDNCSKDGAIQNATGCPGQDAGLNMLNDGQGEINILNAIGYNLVAAVAQPVVANKPLVDFDTVDFPADSAKQDGLELMNTGSTPITIGTIAIVGTYGDVSQFTFDSSKCDKNLKPGKNCHIDVFFNPDAAIISRATLQISTSPDSTISVPLTGAGSVPVAQ
jgi:hypothetical protein